MDGGVNTGEPFDGGVEEGPGRFNLLNDDGLRCCRRWRWRLCGDLRSGSVGEAAWFNVVNVLDMSVNGSYSVGV